MGETQKASFFNEKVCGMPLKVFIPLSLVVWLIAFIGKLPADIFSTLIFLWTLGSFLQFLGNKTPILGKYIGFGGILPLFGASLLVTIGLINPDLKAQCGGAVNSTIIPILVGILLCGSILGKLNRETLKKAAIRYIPVILVGQVFAIGGSFLIGKLLGYDLFHSVVLVAFPCFCGGSGGPMANIPMAITSGLGIDGTEFAGYMMAGATLANVEAILMCGLLDLLGKARPSLTGNGDLVRSKDKTLDAGDQRSAKFDGNFNTLFKTMIVIGLLVVAGSVIASLLKPIINLNYLVYVILLCVIVKLTGVLPKDWEEGMAHWMGFAMPLFLPALIAGMGIGSIDLVATFSSITPAFFVLVTSTVLFFVLGSMIGGWIVGFYPVEAGISVGCCSCNIGGTGDILCCETAHRMNLYPFASLSTRLGGAIALLELGLVLQFVHL